MLPTGPAYKIPTRICFRIKPKYCCAILLTHAKQQNINARKQCSVTENTIQGRRGGEMSKGFTVGED